MIIDLNQNNEFYAALLRKDPQYEGLFFVGVKTTGAFCRSTCPARKPKFENCEFFTTVQEALLASFRPCKRCRPLSMLNSPSDMVQKLVDAVENDPERRWKESDLSALKIDPSTARRQFKNRFGITFFAYARSKRLGLALKLIRAGKTVIESQVHSEYDSGSGFRHAFHKLFGSAPSASTQKSVLWARWIETKLGPMIAISDDSALYLLEFLDRRGLENEILDLRKRKKCVILPGKKAPLLGIERELQTYFEGKKFEFHTPTDLLGTEFQLQVWQALLQIPVGQTLSYGDVAKKIGNPKAFRAVARANGANRLALIIPCHRVINSDGSLGGYGGGMPRKKWLLELESNGAKKCQ